jgi:hypothetical protein
MTTYAKRKLKYSQNENFNLLHYVEWDRIITLAGAKSGMRVTLSYLVGHINQHLEHGVRFSQHHFTSDTQ